MNTVLKSICLLSVALFLHGWTLMAQTTAQPGEIILDLSVEYRKKEKGHFLQVSLANKGRQFETYVSRLPWSHWHSLTIHLSRKNGQIIPAQEFIDDPLPGTTTVKQGQLLKGEIALQQRFPGIGDIITEEPLDLFWVYELKSVDGASSNRTGGWISITKSK